MVRHAEHESRMTYAYATAFEREWRYPVTSCKDRALRRGIIRNPVSRLTSEVLQVRYVMEDLHLQRGSSEVIE